MQNLVQDGKVITVVAPYALTAGHGCLVGSLFGISVNDSLISVDAEIYTEGVFDIAKTSALAIAQGDKVYWDDSAHVVNTTSSGVPVGVATAAAANPSATVSVKLEPNLAAVAATVNDSYLADVAESDVIGGVPVVFMVPIAAGALGNTDITVTHKIRVLDAYLILRGAGVSTTTLQVFKGATGAITDAMAASGSDTALVRAAVINDAYYEIAAGGTLRVTSATGATQPDALVVVTAVRVA